MDYLSAQQWHANMAAIRPKYTKLDKIYVIAHALDTTFDGMEELIVQQELKQ